MMIPDKMQNHRERLLFDSSVTGGSIRAVSAEFDHSIYVIYLPSVYSKEKANICQRNRVVKMTLYF